MRRHVAASAAVLLPFLVLAGPARADGDPIMPLADVRPGMECEARSVVKGTDIATFSARVEDVVAGDAAARQPYLLLRLSGPAIDRTGVGPGFSGSPVYCPDAEGTPRVAGAISEGIGEFGGLLVLATPIEQVLAEPVDGPAPRTGSADAARPRTARRRAAVRSARPLGSPLTVSGLSPAVLRELQAAGRRVKRIVLGTPSAPRAASFPPQTLRPGSAMAVSLASGDVTAGSIGTVTYVDGDRVWGFGHPLDSVGRRSLFLQDAYVYAVVDNPNASPELQTYKYAAPGNDLGVLSWDGVNAVAGRLGVLPERFPLRIVATDLDRGRTQVANVMVSDERPIGQPSGASALGTVGPIAVAQLAYNALGSSPVRQSGSMCMRIVLRERSKPIRFCNSYVGGAPGPSGVAGGPIVSDVGAAAELLDSFRFGPIHIASVEVNIRLRRSLDQAYLLGASAPGVVRRGRRVPVRLKLRRVDGPRSTRTVRVLVPRSTPRGDRRLVIRGTSADLSASAGEPLESVLDLGALLGEEGEEPDEAGPRSVAALAREIEKIHREDGVSVRFEDPDAESEEQAGRGRVVLRDGRLRISGRVSVPLTVR